MRNRRKAVSLLTGLLVTAQLFPTAALAADSSESALNKAPGYQEDVYKRQGLKTALIEYDNQSS